MLSRSRTLKVHHVVLVGIPEVAARRRERIENGGACLLTPNGFLVARWGERDPQVLLVPVPPTLSDREPGRTVLRFPSLFPLPFRLRSHAPQLAPREEEGLCLCGCRCRYAELVPA
jgi:hypothetical protein